MELRQNAHSDAHGVQLWVLVGTASHLTGQGIPHLEGAYRHLCNAGAALSQDTNLRVALAHMGRKNLQLVMHNLMQRTLKLVVGTKQFLDGPCAHSPITG